MPEKQIGMPFHPKGAFKEFVIIPKEVLAYSGLSPAEKLVLGVVYKYAALSGVCYASISTIAKEVSSSRRWAQVAITRLESEHFIKIEKRPGSSSKIYPLWNKIFVEGEKGCSHLPEHDRPHPPENDCSHAYDGSFPPPKNERSHKKYFLKEEKEEKKDVIPTPLGVIKERYPDFPGLGRLSHKN